MSPIVPADPAWSIAVRVHSVSTDAVQTNDDRRSIGHWMIASWRDEVAAIRLIPGGPVDGGRWRGGGSAGAGERLANPRVDAGRRRRDTALTVAALVPAALFLVMLVAGSMHGLVAFGLEVLGWRDGWEYLVPATLDGVSVAFP